MSPNSSSNLGTVVDAADALTSSGTCAFFTLRSTMKQTII